MLLEIRPALSAAQVWVGATPVGQSRGALNSSFNTGDAAGYKKDLKVALAT